MRYQRADWLTCNAVQPVNPGGGVCKCVRSKSSGGCRLRPLEVSGVVAFGNGDGFKG